MSREFNGSSTYLSVTDNAALSLPDGGFTLAGWINPDVIVGPQYFLSHGNFAAVSSCNLYMSSAYLVANLRSDDGTTKNIGWSAGAMSAETWHHITLRCIGDDLRIYVNGVQSGVSSSTAWNGTNPPWSLVLGGRRDLNADRFFDGHMAEWAKWDSAITDNDMTALVDGESSQAISVQPVWYIPLLTDYAEKIVPLTVTNTNTTQSDHPNQMYAPNRRRLYAMGVGI